MFLGGLLWRIIAAGAIVAVGGAIYAYIGVLHDYQRDRVNVFLGITDDPLGAGYHVLQSKIAIGSAGLFGRGYLQGTQSQLDFLPEKHTDFIFTMIVEEFGLLGGALVLGLFGALMALTMQVALRARSLFGKLAAGRRRRDAGVLRLHQHRDGDRPCARRRHSAADHLLRRHRHDHADGRLRHRAVDRPAPRPARRARLALVNASRPSSLTSGRARPMLPVARSAIQSVARTSASTMPGSKLELARRRG